MNSEQVKRINQTVERRLRRSSRIGRAVVAGAAVSGLLLYAGPISEDARPLVGTAVVLTAMLGAGIERRQAIQTSNRLASNLPGVSGSPLGVSANMSINQGILSGIVVYTAYASAAGFGGQIERYDPLEAVAATAAGTASLILARISRTRLARTDTVFHEQCLDAVSADPARLSVAQESVENKPPLA